MDSLLVAKDQILPLALRAVVVYAFLLVALRVAGRRELAQMTSFDLILLLVVSNAVQNSINAGDNSLTGGMVSAAVLIGVNWVVGYAAWRWRRVERIVQGKPLRVITDGKIHVGALRRELLTVAELRSALRKQGISRLGECKAVTLEADGTLSVLRSDVPQRPVTELLHPDRRYAGPA
jgi:uncharacterized membrane protein YcaP (DUF421 family)